MDAILKTDNGYYLGTIDLDLKEFKKEKRIYKLKEFKEGGFISLNSYLRKQKRLNEEDEILKNLNGERLYLNIGSEIHAQLDKNIDSVKRKSAKKIEKRKKVSQLMKDDKKKRLAAKKNVDNPYARDIEVMKQYGNEYYIKCLQCNNECKRKWDNRIGSCRQYTTLQGGYLDLKYRGKVDSSNNIRKRFAIEYFKFCDDFFDEKLWPEKTDYKQLIKFVIPREKTIQVGLPEE